MRACHLPLKRLFSKHMTAALSESVAVDKSGKR
jgi:hypothetical protein